jgi:hypothetical protein
MTTPNVNMSVNRRGLGVSPFSGGDIIAVIGPATSGDINTPLPMGSSSSITGEFTRGPLAQLATYIREARIRDQPLGRTIVCVRCATSTAGAVGDLDLDDFDGTAVPAKKVTTSDDDYQYRVIFDVGGTLETDGIVYRVSKNDGDSYGPKTALGIGTTIVIPNSGGVSFDLDPASAEVTKFIALAVEARADTLAHLADVTAHDAADTSSAQVALAASSAPTTAAQAWAVMNLCRAALEAHRVNITAHNGPDPINVVSHAVATSTSSGVGLALEYKADFNAHLGIALAASAAGLKAATATVEAEVVLTDEDLLSAGLALLATYPRRLTFTTAGSTAADAPASVLIEGFDYLDAAQSETLNLAQTAAMVTSVKAYKGPLTLTYPAADGTDATVAIGYEKAVHNSADVTNVLTQASPAHGTIEAGDEFAAEGSSPLPSDEDLDAALAALQATKMRWDLAVVATPVSTSDEVAVLTDRISAWETLKRYRPILVNFRFRAAGETAADYRVAFKALFDAVYRDGLCAGYDAGLARSRIDGTARYRRPAIWGVAAKAVAAAPGEDLAFVDKGLGLLPDFDILDDNGNALFHDEDTDPGPDDDRAITLRTVPDYEGTFITNPKMLAEPGTDLFLLQYYRAIAKAVRTVNYSLTGLLSVALAPDAKTGRLASQEIADLRTNVLADLNRDVIAEGWAVAADVGIDGSVNFKTSPVIPVEVSVTPYLYAKEFSVTIGLKNPFAPQTA